MKTITFECETITPMFLSGADGITPELRPPSIKGAMRFWWRAMNGHLPLAELKKREGEIFGSGGEKASQSTFSITVNHAMDTNSSPFVPHKDFMKQMAFSINQSFTVKLLFKSDKYVHDIGNLFVLVSFLGGFGKRSRRGMGSFIIKEIVGHNVDVSEIDANKAFSLQNIKKVMYKINPFMDYELSDKIRLRSKTKEQYPFIEVIEEIETTTGNENVLKFISEQTHQISQKHKEKASYAMGNAKGFRFSSPVVVRAFKNNVVFTKLGTYPPPKYRNYVDLRIQDEYIGSVKKGLEDKKRENNKKDQTTVTEQNDESFRQSEEKLDKENLNASESTFDWFDYIQNLEVDIRLSKVILNDFKGYKNDHTFEFDKDLTLIIGDNGYGKTSLLEGIAISLDYFAKEFFNKSLETNTFNQNMVFNGKDVFSIKSFLEFHIKFKPNSIVLENEELEKFENELLKYEKISDKQIDKLENEIDGSKVDDNNESFVYLCSYINEFTVMYNKFTGTEFTFETDEIDNWNKKLKYEFSKSIVKFPVVFFGNRIENDFEKEVKFYNQNLYVYENALTSKRYNFEAIMNWVANKLQNEIFEVNNQKIEIWKFYFQSLITQIETALNTENSEVTYEISLLLNKDEKKELHEYQYFTYNVSEKKNKFLDKPKYNTVVDFYDKLIQNFELVITKIETRNNKTEQIDVKYSELSAGEKNIICLVSDIITRIYFSTQKIEGFNTQEDFDNYLREAKAIVLIDELDLHLHPKWQREILPKLRKMFPSVQFVITTHSPFVVQNLENDYLIQLAKNETEIIKGVTYKGFGLEEIVSKVLADEKTINQSEFIDNYTKFNNAIKTDNQVNLEVSFKWLAAKLSKQNPIRPALEMQYKVFKSREL